MIMSDALENVDLAGKVLKQLLCELGTEDRLDGDRFFRHLIDKRKILGVNCQSMKELTAMHIEHIASQGCQGQRTEL